MAARTAGQRGGLSRTPTRARTQPPAVHVSTCGQSTFGVPTASMAKPGCPLGRGAVSGNPRITGGQGPLTAPYRAL